MTETIAFMGAGNMAGALIEGLIRAGVASPGDIVASEPRDERRAELEAAHGIRTSADNVEAVAGADVVVLSVKPQIIDDVLADLSEALTPDALVISIAAGVPLARLEAGLPPETRVIRTMPNTPALVGAGATALAGGTHATGDDLALARKLFDAVGITFVVGEGLIDAVSGLSGSGPAFVYLFIEALSDGGVEMGLPRATALALAAQTVRGAGAMALAPGAHPAQLKDQVTSPGGTTIAGVHALERGGLRAAVMDAVKAATERSRELGGATR
ncbi:MAG: pyrroline-5-carboxylate reductase [Myxococcales bacterium]|nr:pyrroline-5-carboxylate reductase [Myxococcales bacterium]